MTKRPDDRSEAVAVQRALRWSKVSSHPVRLAILDLFADEPGRLLSPTEIFADLGISLAVASYHLHRLEVLGELELVKRTQVRGTLKNHYGRPKRMRHESPTSTALLAGWRSAQALERVLGTAAREAAISPEAHADAAAIVKSLAALLDRLAPAQPTTARTDAAHAPEDARDTHTNGGLR